MRHAFLLYLFLLTGSFYSQSEQVQGDDQPDAAEAVQPENSFEQDKDAPGDSAGYILREPSDEMLNRLKKDKDLNYSETEGPANLFEFISLWINQQFRKIFSSKGYMLIQEYLSYLIAAAALIIVIIILYKNKLSGIIYGFKDEHHVSFRENNEHINKIDFDSLISSALAAKEYRIAARYQYLKSLKLLSDKKIIDWQINKTNVQYIQEISDRELKKSFRELTILFEWFWYGNYPVEELLYFRAHDTFTSFNTRLSAAG